MRKIVIDTNICNGKPTIEGTRITAQTVLAGDTGSRGYGDAIR